MTSPWVTREYEIEGDDGEQKIVMVKVQCAISSNGGRDEPPWREVDWKDPVPLLTINEQERLIQAIDADDSLFEDAFEPDWDAMNDAKDDR